MASLLSFSMLSLGMMRPTWRSWKRLSAVLRCLVYCGEHVCWNFHKLFSCIFDAFNFFQNYHLSKMFLFQLVKPNWFLWDMGSRSCRSWWLLLMTLYPWTPLLRNAWQLSHATSISRAVTLLHSTKSKFSCWLLSLAIFKRLISLLLFL